MQPLQMIQMHLKFFISQKEYTTVHISALKEYGGPCNIQQKNCKKSISAQLPAASAGSVPRFKEPFEDRTLLQLPMHLQKEKTTLP